MISYSLVFEDAVALELAEIFNYDFIAEIAEGAEKRRDFYHEFHELARIRNKLF